MPDPAPARSALEKLTIFAFADRRRTSKRGSVRAMFNPQSLSRTYSVAYVRSRGVKSFQRVAEFSAVVPGDLSLTLLFDGTGVTGQAATAKPVHERVRAFMNLCYRIDGQTHEPAYLVVQWGAMAYSCRLAEVTVAYTAFNRDGTPLRAELSVRFVADEDPIRTAKGYNMASPDVSHGRTVAAGDTLPLLSHQVYGTPDHYLRVARFNGLDNLRHLKPGRPLTLPPLVRRRGRRPCAPLTRPPSCAAATA